LAAHQTPDKVQLASLWKAHCIARVLDSFHLSHSVSAFFGSCKYESHHPYRDRREPKNTYLESKIARELAATGKPSRLLAFLFISFEHHFYRRRLVLQR
jgi:hypothetical protein